jgi:hypothetical protein
MTAIGGWTASSLSTFPLRGADAGVLVSVTTVLAFGWFSMNAKAKAATLKVIKEAGNAPHFFDFSDAERLTWMIARAYELGCDEIKNNHTSRRAGTRGGSSRSAR